VAVVLLIAGLGSGFVRMLGPVPEQLVEGHTVFTALQTTYVTSATANAHFAAAVAVLIRDFHHNTVIHNSRFPGVLWFNDQYLVECGENGLGDSTPGCASSSTLVNTKTVRYPCGAAMAVRAGDPDPRNGTFDATTYVGTYHITDPNNHAWDVDKWSLGGELVWTVPLTDRFANYNDTSTTSDCGMDSGQGFTYNAVLYFELQDLTITGAKNHTAGSTDRAQDTNGCQVGAFNYKTGAYEWPCPANDDDREGDSHDFNPGNSFPSQNSVARGNHGGSADCTGDAAPDPDCHATARIDIYYGGLNAPTSRNYLLFEAEGSAAPFYCEPDIKTCNQGDYEAQAWLDTGFYQVPPNP
jgi:hypothetical protein